MGADQNPIIGHPHSDTDENCNGECFLFEFIALTPIGKTLVQGFRKGAQGNLILPLYRKSHIPPMQKGIN